MGFSYEVCCYNNEGHFANELAQILAYGIPDFKQDCKPGDSQVTRN